MIDQKTVNKIKQSPLEERIQIIELILQTLKNDIKQKTKDRESNSKPFKVHKFKLGNEVHVDREELYSDRGI